MKNSKHAKRYHQIITNAQQYNLAGFYVDKANKKNMERSETVR